MIAVGESRARGLRRHGTKPDALGSRVEYEIWNMRGFEDAVWPGCGRTLGRVLYVANCPEGETKAYNGMGGWEKTESNPAHRRGLEFVRDGLHQVRVGPTQRQLL